jgi:hypothetical protein
MFMATPYGDFIGVAGSARAESPMPKKVRLSPDILCGISHALAATRAYCSIAGKEGAPFAIRQSAVTAWDGRALSGRDGFLDCRPGLSRLLRARGLPKQR